jgi:hypothetical protein
MDCVCARNFSSGNDARDFEVTFFSRRGTDAHSFIGKLDVERIAVGL